MKIIPFILIAFFLLLTSFPAQIKAGRRGRRPMPNNPMPAECKHIDDCVAPLINVSQRNNSHCCNAFKSRESIQYMRTLFASNDSFIRFGTVGICKAICPELSNCSYRPKTYRLIPSSGSRK